MICPNCNAEYLKNISDCGDCKVSLIEASTIDIPIPKMTWISLPILNGSTYSEMIIEIFNKKNIPHYVKNNWSASALNIKSSDLINDTIKIFVPKSYEAQGVKIINTIIGELK